MGGGRRWGNSCAREGIQEDADLRSDPSRKPPFQEVVSSWGKLIILYA
jgi:hypothetical protein